MEEEKQLTLHAYMKNISAVNLAYLEVHMAAKKKTAAKKPAAKKPAAKKKAAKKKK